jgi:hypothetical protein
MLEIDSWILSEDVSMINSSPQATILTHITRYLENTLQITSLSTWLARYQKKVNKT